MLLMGEVHFTFSYFLFIYFFYITDEAQLNNIKLQLKYYMVYNALQQTDNYNQIITLT